MGVAGATDSIPANDRVWSASVASFGPPLLHEPAILSFHRRVAGGGVRLNSRLARARHQEPARCIAFYVRGFILTDLCDVAAPKNSDRSVRNI
jgi:hypothetical protein